VNEWFKCCVTDIQMKLRQIPRKKNYKNMQDKNMPDLINRIIWNATFTYTLTHINTTLTNLLLEFLSSHITMRSLHNAHSYHYVLQQRLGKWLTNEARQIVTTTARNVSHFIIFIYLITHCSLVNSHYNEKCSLDFLLKFCMYFLSIPYVLHGPSHPLWCTAKTEMSHFIIFWFKIQHNRKSRRYPNAKN
jgi:hypothetical protein